MEIPDDTPRLNLNNTFPAPGVMARIATMLELHGRIYVENAATAGEGPGFSASLLGRPFEKAEIDRMAIREKTEVADGSASNAVSP